MEKKNAQPLVDCNDCVGACVLLINIAIKYRSTNGQGGWVFGGHATELFADLQACVLHTDNAETPQTLYESSHARER